ncbi:MAG: hypothetical protein ACW99G_00400 [Candidatus Thorarchaeota archaeon]|jgi:hypothetical protein
MDDENKEVEKVEGQFIDPVTTGPVFLFVLYEMIKATIGFFTVKCIGYFWDRKKKENAVDSPPED